jgi:hypothetical protein
MSKKSWDEVWAEELNRRAHKPTQEELEDLFSSVKPDDVFEHLHTMALRALNKKNSQQS